MCRLQKVLMHYIVELTLEIFTEEITALRENLCESEMNKNQTVSLTIFLELQKRIIIQERDCD